MSAAQQALASRYVPLANALARPVKRAWPALAGEFESAAMFALVRAALSFQPARQVSFGTYCRWRVQGALKDVRRAEASRSSRPRPALVPRIKSLSEPIDRGEWPLNRSPAPAVGAWCEALDEVECWLSRLPAKHAQACRELYLHERTHQEVAQLLGCTKGHVACLHRQAIGMLRQAVPEASRHAGAG